ncbi:MaoC/PaaZ C-terminal domain-containing protein [Nocardioides campestrisoli]|uniref:MaoC/PaaZ C-terminal domain-containing protein n=1 Tax=Nocardioides campestrisoli TaxID=2736757 RepID=UPI00163DAB9B|nr:MaoC/PaaZ C-terminal domain-containing protein [Nocardioides campestrisoli]
MSTSAVVHPLVGREYPPVCRRYDARDVCLYALGVGTGEESPHLVFEGHRDFAALPTFPLVLPFPDVLGMGLPDGSTLDDVLHGEQSLVLRAPVPVAGEAVSRCRVVAARDKGAAALFDVEARIEVDGVHVATATYSTFVRGAGGWGGERGSPRPDPEPTGEPDLVLEHEVSANQALVYRLSGDSNPLHADVETARRAGHERPILHGLSTVGTAVRLALESTGGRLERMTARFTGPVLPGERIRVSLWTDGPASWLGRVDVVGREGPAVAPLSLVLTSP